MEVQTIEKKPTTGKQTVTATEETSSVAERSKEVIIKWRGKTRVIQFRKISYFPELYYYFRY